MSAFAGKADIQLIRCDVRVSPKADMRGPGLLLCKLTPEPHFANHKSLL
jgi:hypothetical protein